MKEERGEEALPGFWFLVLLMMLMVRCGGKQFTKCLV
jgi:hypothetical protein